MSTLPLAPLTVHGVADLSERVMQRLAIEAWTLADYLRDGGSVERVHARIVELGAERDAISERYALERVASEAVARVAS